MTAATAQPLPLFLVRAQGTGLWACSRCGGCLYPGPQILVAPECKVCGDPARPSLCPPAQGSQVMSSKALCGPSQLPSFLCFSPDSPSSNPSVRSPGFPCEREPHI